MTMDGIPGRALTTTGGPLISDSNDGANGWLALVFEGKGLTFYTFRGRICTIAFETGMALEYGDDGKTLATLIRRDWAAEFIPGKHFDVLTGETLREFKAKLPLTESDSVSGRARHVMILYEAGVDLVCLKTEKPIGATLRKLLVDRVIPFLRRGVPVTLPVAAPSAAGVLEQTVASYVAPIQGELDEVRDRLRALEAKPLRQLRLLNLGEGSPTEEEIRARAIELAGDPARTFTSREHLAMLLRVPLSVGRVVVAELLSTGDLTKEGGRIVARPAEPTPPKPPKRPRRT